MMKTKYEVVKNETFETRKVYSFTDPSEGDSAPLLVAYQLGNKGSQRMAIVNEYGKVIVAASPTLHEFPCIAEFGKHRFVAISTYFAGENMTPEQVYRLECGDQKRFTRVAEKPQKQIEPEAVPWVGWFIEECHCSGTDLLEVSVRMRHTNGEAKTIEETLDPPCDYAKVERCENYGGSGKNQQSILITISNRDGEACHDTQLEIDYKTGTFQEDKYGEWSAA